MQTDGPHAVGARRLPDPVPTLDAESRVVLVADDDDATRAAVRHQLERRGYDVVESSSGRDALRRLREGVAPRFLVIDLRMPDGSGGWLVSQVGYEFPRLISRTVVITGDAGSAMAAHVAARWGCPVLPKPFDGPELVDTLSHLASGAADVA